MMPYRYYPTSVRETEEQKDTELVELASKWGRENYGGKFCLPRIGLVKLVFENCPTWKKEYGDADPRGAAVSIGRRVDALNIPRVEK